MNITIGSHEHKASKVYLELGLIKPNESHSMEPTQDHKFKPGEVLTLCGLVDVPQYNGEQVTVTAIREDGPKGRAYYIQGRINECLNWVYEFRLSANKTLT